MMIETTHPVRHFHSERSEESILLFGVKGFPPLRPASWDYGRNGMNGASRDYGRNGRNEASRDHGRNGMNGATRDSGRKGKEKDRRGGAYL